MLFPGVVRRLCRGRTWLRGGDDICRRRLILLLLRGRTIHLLKGSFRLRRSCLRGSRLRCGCLRGSFRHNGRLAVLVFGLCSTLIVFVKTLDSPPDGVAGVELSDISGKDGFCGSGTGHTLQRTVQLFP